MFFFSFMTDFASGSSHVSIEMALHLTCASTCCPVPSTSYLIPFLLHSSSTIPPFASKTFCTAVTTWTQSFTILLLDGRPLWVFLYSGDILLYRSRCHKRIFPFIIIRKVSRHYEVVNMAALNIIV